MDDFSLRRLSGYLVSPPPVNDIPKEWGTEIVILEEVLSSILSCENEEVCHSLASFFKEKPGIERKFRELWERAADEKFLEQLALLRQLLLKEKRAGR